MVNSNPCMGVDAGTLRLYGVCGLRKKIDSTQVTPLVVLDDADELNNMAWRDPAVWACRHNNIAGGTPNWDIITK
eukprot:9076569-Pyramimonas_sp.AAC.1